MCIESKLGFHMKSKVFSTLNVLYDLTNYSSSTNEGIFFGYRNDLILGWIKVHEPSAFHFLKLA